MTTVLWIVARAGPGQSVAPVGDVDVLDDVAEPALCGEDAGLVQQSIHTFGGAATLWLWTGDCCRTLIAAETVATLRTVGRNDPCPCGSGNKFKRCHGVTA